MTHSPNTHTHLLTMIIIIFHLSNYNRIIIIYIGICILFFFVDIILRMANQCNCGEIHSHEVELGVKYNLYGKIDKNGAECLNELEEGSGISVFKPWEDRLNCDKVLKMNDNVHLILQSHTLSKVKQFR